jgi:predicted nucleic acid-binding protein
MICLDTSCLIRALIPGTADARNVERWIRSEEALILPTVAWYEFLCGCIVEEEQLALSILTGGLRDFGDSEARLASQMFRELRKPRYLRVDAMIAATAITSDARLATNNRADFEPFVPHGLELL